MSKRIVHFISLFILGCFTAVSCGDKPVEDPDYHGYLPGGGGNNTVVDSSIIEPEDNPLPYEHKPISDLVLFYGGSHHRNPVDWTQNYVADYLTYQDKSGVKHWLFDGILCLEFMMTQYGVTLITGYSYDCDGDGKAEYLPSAKKEHWQALVDYYFKKGGNLDAIEDAMSSAVATMGTPRSKIKIVIGLPEPIKCLDSHTSTGGNTYWGKLGDTEMNFAKSSDRILAEKWFMSQIIHQFEAKNYKYLTLDGFYWVAEKASNSRDICSAVGKYANDLGYSFNWIPYYNANGYDEWKSLGFNQAYLQPNYFFSDQVEFSRLSSACNMALEAGMGIEVEFDGNALASNGRGYKLRDYMGELKNFGFWANSPIAYYQGSWALKWLKDSANAENQSLYHDFCTWVTTRPYRDK